MKSRELTIHGIGVQERMPPRIVERPQGTGDYLFMVFFEPVQIDVAGKMGEYPGGSIVLWDRGAGHIYGATDGHWNHSWTHCDGTLLDKWLSENDLPRNTPIHLPDPWMCDAYLQDMHFELTHYVQPDPVIVECLMRSFLREISRVVKGGGRKEPVPSNLLALRSYIEANYEQAMTLEALARRVHLSVPHLCSQFKRYFGVSAIGYVIQLRLHQAAYLLQDQTLTITDVARRVGYDDIFYFSKLFKAHFGASPRNARQRMRSPQSTAK